MTDRFVLSEMESRATSLNIGRWSGERLDKDWLAEQVNQGTFDIYKLSLEANDPELYQKLDQLNLPYYLVGMVQEYRVNFKKIPLKKLYHEDASLVLLDDTNREELRKLVMSSFHAVPGSFFQNPWLVDRFSMHDQSKLLADYISGFRPDREKGKECHLLKHRGQYVGFIVNEHYNNLGFARYAGVSPGAKAPGYYIDLVRFIQNCGINYDLEWGFASAQIQNTVVHKVYMREDMIPYKSYINIHINNPHAQ